MAAAGPLALVAAEQMPAWLYEPNAAAVPPAPLMSDFSAHEERAAPTERTVPTPNEAQARIPAAPTARNTSPEQVQGDKAQHSAQPNETQPNENKPSAPPEPDVLDPDHPNSALIARRPANTTDSRGRVAAVGQAFPLAYARRMMSRSAIQANLCAQKGLPYGDGLAHLTFSPEGVVTVVKIVTPKFTSGRVGECVAEKLLETAPIPAFDGPALTVKKTFFVPRR
jgi:hypothetical protein